MREVSTEDVSNKASGAAALPPAGPAAAVPAAAALLAAGPLPAAGPAAPLVGRGPSRCRDPRTSAPPRLRRATQPSRPCLTSRASPAPCPAPCLQAGMELRVLHAAARRATWYGQWRYGFGRGGFNMTPQQASARRLGCLCACALVGFLCRCATLNAHSTPLYARTWPPARPLPSPALAHACCATYTPCMTPIAAALLTTACTRTPALPPPVPPCPPPVPPLPSPLSPYSLLA